jgi:hypothetical protein
MRVLMHCDPSLNTAWSMPSEASDGCAETPSLARATTAEDAPEEVEEAARAARMRWRFLRIWASNTCSSQADSCSGMAVLATVTTPARDGVTDTLEDRFRRRAGCVYGEPDGVLLIDRPPESMEDAPEEDADDGGAGKLFAVALAGVDRVAVAAIVRGDADGLCAGDVAAVLLLASDERSESEMMLPLEVLRGDEALQVSDTAKASRVLEEAAMHIPSGGIRGMAGSVASAACRARQTAAGEEAR